MTKKEQQSLNDIQLSTLQNIHKPQNKNSIMNNNLELLQKYNILTPMQELTILSKTNGTR